MGDSRVVFFDNGLRFDAFRESYSALTDKGKVCASGGTVNIVVSYPLHKPAVFRFTSETPFTKEKLARAVYKAYKCVFAEEGRLGGEGRSSYPHRKTSNGRFQTWGYDLQDLTVRGLYKKKGSNVYQVVL